MENSKVMPHENNYQSVKPKTNNYLNELQQNQSRFQPNQKNFSNRKEKKEESPLKPSNKAKKAISYEEQNFSSNKSNLQNRNLNQNYGEKSSNPRKALQGNVQDMIENSNRSSINPVNRFYEIEQQKKNEIYSMNPQFMKPFSLMNNQSNVYPQQKVVSQNIEVQEYSSGKKQSSISSKKEIYQNEDSQMRFIPKESSPNIIMAIMSLLDDLTVDGLEIIKRETERKIVEKKHEEKVKESSAVKNYKRV